MKKPAKPQPPPEDLVAWAAEQVGACDCAGGCWCDQYRRDALNYRRAGLVAALRVVAGPSFITKKKIKDLIAEVDKVVKP